MRLDLDKPELWLWRLVRHSLDVNSGVVVPDGVDINKISDWQPARFFPSCIHMELEAAGIVPKLFVGMSEKDLLWIGETDWEYCCNFQTPDEPIEESNMDLVFEGLDTVATITFNDQVVSKSDNMFVPVRVDVGKILHLTPGAWNTICLRFDSAFRTGKELEKVHGQRSVWNGDASRIYVRKAQYHWSWDWGPVTITCGPWKSIWMHLYKYRLDEVYAKVEVDENLSVDVSCLAVVEPTPVAGEITAEFRLVDPNDVEVGLAKYALVGNNTAAPFHLESPKLWWPSGKGKQDLYKLEVVLRGADNAVLDKQTQNVGIRRCRLIEKEIKDSASGDNVSTTFYFEINNVPVFCGGSNWIPADSYLPRISRQRYIDWLSLAKSGNQNMIRIWGGGIYEDEVFYDTCDKLGILVWQDFMFACGAYPAHEEFVKSIDIEARSVIRRLRRHPCVTILTGNNEDYAFAESNYLGYDPSNQNEDDWLKSGFPARYIYERTLPNAVSELWPGMAYKPGSPWSPGGRWSSDPYVGDIHQWNVWHGMQDPYQNYGRLAGRFVSEFGMQGYPQLSTVAFFFDEGTPKSSMDPFSAVVDFHNKAGGFTRRLGGYMFENLRFSTKLSDYCYATQVMQAEAVGEAFRKWRSKWATDARSVGGALVWQLNDCWPCVSWSIADYWLNPKPSFFAIKRELAPVSVIIERLDGSVRVVATNVTEYELKVVLNYGSFSMSKKKSNVADGGIITLPANTATVLPLIDNVDTSSDVVLRVILVLAGTGGNLSEPLAWAADWPQPLRHLPFPFADPKIQMQVDPSGECLCVTSQGLAKGVWISYGDEDYSCLDDNYIDLFPGETRMIKMAERVRAKGARQHFRARWLYDWEL